jgi:flavin-dependent dehydrogenase
MSDSISAKTVSDVVVIGGGLAGLAASIHLAKAGLEVICLEPVEQFREIVGESLDWSAPALFEGLGMKMEDLVASGAATYKRHVILKLQDGQTIEYVPSDWLEKPPFNVEVRTLHLDRLRLHEKLRELAEGAGVEILRERATNVALCGDKVYGVETESGMRFSARWFVDASGSKSSFLAREFRLPLSEYAPRKVGIWSYADVDQWQEGTTLYASCTEGNYLQWLWEIPVNPNRVSIGLVTTGAELKRQRWAGLTVDEVLRGEMTKFARFENVAASMRSPAVTSFTCHAYRGVCGLNWVIVGEAAAVPDPITGNGVTSALRHASEAAKLIAKYHCRGAIPWRKRVIYNMRVHQMGKFFNSLIVKLAYGCTLRDRFGLLKTGDLYTAIAWSVNHLYTRIGPEGAVKTLLFCAPLALIRALVWAFERVFRFATPLHPLVEVEAA